ncbi:MAG: hypothetical protein FJ255_12080 [Phycisphaerae bacterium]|nr:hypothetical protein [Phycisphaerae bacterium]
MSAASPPPAPPRGALERHHFLLRRLHSLTGIVPIGVFLVAHLVTNSSLIWGKAGLRGAHPELGWLDGGIAYFAEEVRWINTQVPHLLLVEIVLWVSIAFHAGLGVLYARSGRNNVARYAYGGNRRYAAQRLTGYVAIAFIFYHVATLRWGWTFLVPGGTHWSAEFAGSTLAAAIKGGQAGWTLMGVGVALLYFVGVSATVFHFANGLWTAAITWGLTISTGAQRRWGYACLAMGAALMLAGWSSLAGALMMDPASAARVEAMVGAPAGPGARQADAPTHVAP